MGKTLGIEYIKFRTKQRGKKMPFPGSILHRIAPYQFPQFNYEIFEIKLKLENYV